MHSDQAKLLAGLDVSLAAQRLPAFLPALLCDPSHTAHAIAIALHWCWENDRLSADAVTFACNGLISELTSQAASSAGGFRYALSDESEICNEPGAIILFRHKHIRVTLHCVSQPSDYFLLIV